MSVSISTQEDSGPPPWRGSPLIPIPISFCFVSLGSPSLPGEGLPWSRGQAAPSQAGPPVGFEPQPRGSHLPAPRLLRMLGSLSCGFHVQAPASQVLILRCAANPGPAGPLGSWRKHAASETAQWRFRASSSDPHHTPESTRTKTRRRPHTCAPMHMRTPRPTYPPPAGTSLFSGSLQNLRCGRGWGV